MSILRGAKVGDLIVLDNRSQIYDFFTSNGTFNKTSFRKCKCKCGEIVYIKNSKLINGDVNSCKKCYHTKYQPTTLTLEGKLQFVAREIKYRATSGKGGCKKSEWYLTESQVIFLITQNCYYCNSKPDNIFRKCVTEDINWTGIDRIDSKKSYNTINCVPCCKMCNYMKRAYPYNEFIKKIKDIYEHMNLSNEIKDWKLIA
jgi:hypothetical protein